MPPVVTSGGFRTTAVVLDEEDWERVERIRKEKRHRFRSTTIRELLDLGIKAYEKDKRVRAALEGAV